jgi:hypothetical protein
VPQVDATNGKNRSDIEEKKVQNNIRCKNIIVKASS